MVFKDARFRGDKRALVLPVVAELEARVAKALASAPDLDGSSITVTTRGNCLVLKGFVTSEVERERAADHTRLIEGVIAVDNQLQLR
ncbi:MAG: BON domain-containing protein [Methylobacterium sp.]|nr:BON domain-containing protein [Methylobacterium sp.]